MTSASDTKQKIKSSAENSGDQSSFPCSPGQRRLWVLHELDSANPALNLTQCWRIEGRLAQSHLEKAFRSLIARHAVLRTSFASIENEPSQFEAPQAAFFIPDIDLTTLPEAAALAEAERIVKMESSASFDIASPPLLRVIHLRLRDNVCMLLVTAHRLICDEVSLTILVQEMGEIVAALQAERTPALPPLTGSYGDFAKWQSQCLADETQKMDSEVEYWRRVLQDVKHLEVPTDHTRPAIQTANIRSRSVLLDPELSAGLAKRSEQGGNPLSVTALAGLLALLYRYTDETDLAIGSQFNGRDEEGFELANMVGPFANTLVLRQDLSDDPSFAVLCKRVNETVHAALEHRHIPLEKLIDIVHPARDWSRNTLFSVNFQFQDAFIPAERFRNLRLVELPVCPPGALLDLNFIVKAQPQGWRITCEYNRDLFEDQTIVGILKYFTQLLRAARAEPEKTISSLTLLDEQEFQRLTVENNRLSIADYPAHSTLPELFMVQAERTPDAIAVVCGERQLTYRELDEASTRVAQSLQTRGLAPATRIGVFLDRSTDLLVAILGILKAGSAYIPLDPLYPLERLRHVFENSRPAAVITRQNLHSRLDLDKTPAIVLDADGTPNKNEALKPLAWAASPEEPAYIIYTSGSTGRPKGVQISHRSLVNLLWSMRSQPGLSAADTVVSVTTISFDMVVPDLFLPLIVGAKLVIATEPVVADGAALQQLLQRHKATFMQATPVTWQLLLEAGWTGNLKFKILCGGEAMSRSLAEDLLWCCGQLWNMYGPTETTVWSSALQVTSGEGPVPIGPPLANTQFYILDRHGNLALPGAPGELYIGGDGVALGYFDLPEMTQEKFIPDKFRNVPGAKLYRTGDMMRMRPSGEFEYLGRADQQVKLRGFRIELGEIESVLTHHPDVIEAVAILGKDQSGQGAIWAYAVVRPELMARSAELLASMRTRLLESLPAYMNPAAIQLLENLPRTPNGKIDRRALPAPAPAAVQAKKPALPRSDNERRLTGIWSSILGIEEIDTHSEFFDLGGNSLLAARLLSAIDKEFGKRLSLATLFQSPTISQQAKLLELTDTREFDFRQVVRLHANGSKAPIIAIHNTGVYFYHLSKRLGSEQPLLALQLFDPSISRTSLPQSIEEIAAEYVQLIRQFQPQGPYSLLGWCVGGVLAFEVARQLTHANHSIQLLALIDSWAPGHLARVPRWRARLSDYSYRWKLIAADWRRVTRYQQGFKAFLSHRTLFKKILRLIGREINDPEPVAFEDRNLSPESYDQWLLGYLDNLALRYIPKSYSGKVTLLCSATEPRGLFLDPKMGWGPFACEIEAAIIDGDHFTMFQGEGLKQMARHVSAAVEVHTERRRCHSA